MAPVAPLGKNRALALVRASKLPFTCGSPHPVVCVLEQEGRYRVRELLVDPAEATRAMTAALAAGRGWTPEQHYALGKPTGRVFIEAETEAGLAEAIEAYPWPHEW